ncbi:hypothetical protein AHiyo6_00230 [Arthrobacter sp. Hiyo6]|nr:hypothetical protein AHiyo6_00230 [Arthrobacter sp. Hiyo6]
MSDKMSRQNEQAVVVSDWTKRGGMAAQSAAYLSPPSEVREYETGRAWAAAFRVQNAEGIAEVALEGIVEFDRAADAVTLARPHLTQVAIDLRADLIDGSRAVLRRYLMG